MEKKLDLSPTLLDSITEKGRKLKILNWFLNFKYTVHRADKEDANKISKLNQKKLQSVITTLFRTEEHESCYKWKARDLGKSIFKCIQVLSNSARLAGKKYQHRQLTLDLPNPAWKNTSSDKREGLKNSCYIVAPLKCYNVTHSKFQVSWMQQ